MSLIPLHSCKIRNSMLWYWIKWSKGSYTKQGSDWIFTSLPTTTAWNSSRQTLIAAPFSLPSAWIKNYPLNWSVFWSLIALISETELTEKLKLSGFDFLFDIIGHLTSRLPSTWIELSLEVCFDHIDHNSKTEQKTQIQNCLLLIYFDFIGHLTSQLSSQLD